MEPAHLAKEVHTAEELLRTTAHLLSWNAKGARGRCAHESHSVSMRGLADMMDRMKNQ
jgi:hypothetical protein